METRILITQHVEKNIFPRDILELICVLFSYRLVASHIDNGTQRVAHRSLTCHEDIIGACQEMVRVSQPLIVCPSPRVTSADLSPPQCHHIRLRYSLVCNIDFSHGMWTSHQECPGITNNTGWGIPSLSNAILV